jgi:hypothetical protein
MARHPPHSLPNDPSHPQTQTNPLMNVNQMAPRPPVENQTPPHGGPDKNDGTDKDEQDRDEGNDDKPSKPHREPDNMTVRDLLHLLSPILAVRPDPPPAIAPNAQQLKVNAPDKFDGHNPKKLKSFLVSCNNAFRVDPDTFHLHETC